MYVNPVLFGVLTTLFVLETAFIGTLIYFGIKK